MWREFDRWVGNREGKLLTTYNFSELSDFEFEALCRDLLQEELGLSFEHFTPGRDRGIDLRCIVRMENEKYTIIVQCKRWAENSFSNLRSKLSKEELPKINSLSPQRYILMTSVKLNPDRKDKIVADLEPWIQSPNDVYGKDDLSGLLAKHNEVERRHIKLWLTSSEVLDALLNSDVFNRSEDSLDRAKRQLKLWAPNGSFDRAQEILDVSRVCIISGPPGIGKSMLADVLSASYASQNYQLVAVSEDIDEANRAWRTKARQIFLYDDFLGHVTYGELQLRKNEQSRLTQFLDRVRRSENKRFILTTREYILSEALNRYEHFSAAELATHKSIITLEDYTQFIRGQILYNHLFFSDLPFNLRTALLPDKRYWDVIRHRNYNPRVIEQAVSLPGIDALSPDDFVSNIFATLEDPTKIWKVIFQNLPDIARRILLAIVTLPTQVLLEDIRRVVETLSPESFDAGIFMGAISMIEGTFIDIDKTIPGRSSRQREVVIRDPSVRDYLWSYLKAVEGEADRLLRQAVFFEQCVILYEGYSHAESEHAVSLTSTHVQPQGSALVDYEDVASRAVDLLLIASPKGARWTRDHSGYYRREPMNLERRTSFLIDISVEHQTNVAVNSSARSAWAITIEEWEAGRGSPGDAIELMAQAMSISGFLPEYVLERAEQALFKLIIDSLQQRDGFEALIAMATLRPHLFLEPRRHLASWSSEFEDFLIDERVWLLEEIDDPDLLNDEVQQLGRIASAIGVDITELEADAENRVDELLTGRDWEPDDYDILRESRSEATDEIELAEVDALFQSLR